MASLEELLPAEYLSEFMKISKKKVVEGRECFLRAGDIPKKMAYVQTGLFRYVYIDNAGNDFTKSIIAEGSFIASYSAMVSRSSSYFFIEAIEPSIIYEFGLDSWEALRQTDRFWDQFLIKILEKGFAIKEKRERELLLLDAETRYRNFLIEFPSIESRVTQRTVASYLGIKAESLSRIRKKIHGLT